MSGAKAASSLPKPSQALWWFNIILWLTLGSSVLFPVILLILKLLGSEHVGFSIDGRSSICIAAVYYLGYLYILFGFRNIVGDTLRGQVFTVRNFWRLRRAGWLIFCYAVFVYIVWPILKSGGISNTFTFSFTTTTFLNWFTAALAVLSIAEVFRQGVLIRQAELDLREEQQLTV